LVIDLATLILVIGILILPKVAKSGIKASKIIGIGGVDHFGNPIYGFVWRKSFDLYQFGSIFID